MKRKLILIIFCLAVVLVSGYSFLWIKPSFSDYQHKILEVGSGQNDYDKLVSECKRKQDEGCCLASIEVMKSGNYMFAPQGGCPPGYQQNMMKCVDSYRWCQPAEDSSFSTKIRAGNNLSELQRLNIQVTGGPLKQLQLDVPPVLSDANWGMKQLICKEGGYDLSAYAGKTLSYTCYPTNEIYANIDPLNVWIVSNGDEIVCIYKTVTESSGLAPGIFSVKEHLNIRKK